MSRVYCNECSSYTETTLKEKKHPRDIQETYFKCDHCYHHYTVAVTNRRARKLQRNMKRKRIAYTSNVDDRSNEQVELDSIMDRLKYNLTQLGIAGL